MTSARACAQTDGRLGGRELRLAGAPPAALLPLQALHDEAAHRGNAFFNVPSLFLRATEEALNANAAGLKAVADEAAWDAIDGDATAVAARMRSAAKLCTAQFRTP